MRKSSITITLMGGFAIASGLCSLAADPPAAGKPNVTLVAELTDGSRVVGVPAIEELKLVSSLGKIAVPFKLLAQVSFKTDKETASVLLASGDKLSGVVDLESLHLETTWGKVNIGQEYLKRLDVMTGFGVLPAALKGGLLLHYVFDREQTDSIADRSGHERSGKPSGASWAAGEAIGGALVFKGGNTRVDFSASGLPSGSAPRTLAAWVYQEKTAGRYYVMGYGGDPSGTEFRMSLNEFTPGQFSLETGMGGWHSDASLLAQRWYHLAVTYSGAGSPKFYVNGKEAPTQGGFLSPAIRTVAAGGTLGMRGSNEGGGWLDGRIAEAGIWGRELSADEVRQVYEMRAGMNGIGSNAP
jgi:hypothetical protein